MSNVSSPSTPVLVGPVALGALLVAVTATLSGCTAIMQQLQQVHEESFADYAAAESGWVGVALPEWVPADATELRNLATDDESNSVIRVTSGEPLAGDCVTSQRRTLPFETTDWAPELSPFPKTVQACGDYEVVAVDGGWLGWFAATEPGQTPGGPVSS